MSSLYQIEKLDDTNYDTWCIHMQCVLVHADIWAVVSGDLAKPEDALLLAKWKVENEKALATIMLSVKLSQLGYVKNCTSALEAWEKLKNVYKPRGPIRKVSLYKRLLSLSMAEGVSMVQHIQEFVNVSDKLAELDIKLSEMLVIILLSSLSRNFENVVISMEPRDSFPTLEIIKVKLLEEFDRQSQKEQEGVGVVSQQAFLANSKGENNTSKKQFSGKCFNCGKRGHMASKCKAPKKDKNIGSNDQCSFAVLAASCFRRSSWCIDSGASTHICSERSMFVSLRENKERVMLASEKYVNAVGVGTVLINANCKIYLKDVLFVPTMAGNFISVGKAITNGVSVSFENDCAIIRNQNCDVVLKAPKRNNL